jgi:hypothetical protein
MSWALTQLTEGCLASSQEKVVIFASYSLDKTLKSKIYKVLKKIKHQNNPINKWVNEFNRALRRLTSV